MIDTPGKLYDELHRAFGVGTYDEAFATKPWWKVRNVEVAKIKAMMKKRRVSLDDLVLALEYAVRNRRPVTETWHLFELITEAKKARRVAEKETTTDVRTALADAAAQAMEEGDTTWAARLYNASEDAGADTLQQWMDEKDG